MTPASQGRTAHGTRRRRVAAGGAALGCAVAVLRWLFAVIIVHGTSMEPDLRDGDRVLARRCRLRGLRTGGLVVFREPGLDLNRRPAYLTGAAAGLWVIKRVAAVPGDPVPEPFRAAVAGAAVVPPGAVLVIGSAPDSRDSRSWGFVTAAGVFGVAVARLGPAA